MPSLLTPLTNPAGPLTSLTPHLLTLTPQTTSLRQIPPRELLPRPLHLGYDLVATAVPAGEEGVVGGGAIVGGAVGVGR